MSNNNNKKNGKCSNEHDDYDLKETESGMGHLQLDPPTQNNDFVDHPSPLINGKKRGFNRKRKDKQNRKRGKKRRRAYELAPTMPTPMKKKYKIDVQKSAILIPQDAPKPKVIAVDITGKPFVIDSVELFRLTSVQNNRLGFQNFPQPGGSFLNNGLPKPLVFDKRNNVYNDFHNGGHVKKDINDKSSMQQLVEKGAVNVPPEEVVQMVNPIFNQFLDNFKQALKEQMAEVKDDIVNDNAGNEDQLSE